jgi:EpsI family protein
MTNHPKVPRRTVRLSRRDFVVGAALASASAAGYAAQPRIVNSRIPNSKFDSWIPEHIGPWSVQGTSGVVLPPPDALSDRIYDNLVTRVYSGPDSAQVMMLIAYNYKQDGVLQLHRPEFCYPAGGYQLSSTVPVTLALGRGREIPASAFTAVSATHTEQVLYFTRLGASFPRRWIDQRVSVLWANLHGEIPDGAMMRVSLLGTDQRRALEVLRGFLAAFFDGTPSALHHTLIRDPK